MALKQIPFYASLLGKELAGGVKATNCHVLVYGAIEAHCFGGNGCTASNATIAAETGLKESTVKTIVCMLCRSLWISIERNENGMRKKMDPLLEPLIPIHGALIPIHAKRESPLTIINNNNKQLNNNTSKDLAATQRVFDHYVKLFNASQTYKLSDGRRRKLQARLSDAGEALLTKAITNTANSAWHRGENDRGWKADLDFIIRSYEQVERLANLDGPEENSGKSMEEIINEI